MQSENFVHLHIHSEYSLLDGSIRIKKLLKELISRNASAAALTDHDGMYGILEFYLDAQKKDLYPEGQKNKLKVIAGYEANIAAFSPKATRKTNHLVLLAETDEGYINLIKLCSIANTSGKNKYGLDSVALDWDILQQYAQGLICLTSNLKGELANLVLQNATGEANAYLLQLVNIFGKNNVFVELIDNNLDEQKILIPKLVQLAKELNIDIVATADVHYLHPHDKDTHMSLLAIKHKIQKSTLKDINSTYEFHLATAAEMQQKFAQYPEALSNTVAIANRCNFHVDTKSIFMPDFRQHPNESADDCLIRLAREGLEVRKPTIVRWMDKNFSDTVWQQYKDRLEYEISVIVSMKFSGYFLIVQDFINWAKERQIPVGPGRGSAAGSLVTYALRITNIDPLRFNLLFERFLNPDRISMPDIDTDFCQDRRGEVLDYVYKRYGDKAVAQIVTFGRLKAKNAIKNLARILDWSFKDANEFVKLIPDTVDITLDKAIESEEALQKIVNNDERTKILWDGALKIEGVLNSLGSHAAGVIISDSALDNRCPLMESDGQLLTQFEYKLAEKIGLIKFDFLGLKTLTVIDNAAKFIRESKDPSFDIETINIDDDKVYEFVSTAHVTGIFQLESAGMRKLIASLKPNCFSDIVAVLALFRPGPLGSGMVDDFVSRKHGKTQVEYPYPELEPILADTYGVIVYQEQVQKIAAVLAGYSLGEADLLRRAMGKKDKAEMERQKHRFVSGAATLGKEPQKVGELFDLLAKFAEYGFNKSHSAAYAYVTFQTAFLKTYYPTEFMAAIMSSDLDNTDKIVTYVDDCKRMGIKLLVPCVNSSMFGFSIAGEKAINFGLGAVKGLGRGFVEVLVQERKARGPFKTVPEFIARVEAKRLNKKIMESLIRSGAFDSLATNRAELFGNTETWLKTLSKEAERNSQLECGIFGTIMPTETSTAKAKKLTINNNSKNDVAIIQKFRQKYGVYFPLATPTLLCSNNSPVAHMLNAIQLKPTKPWTLKEHIDHELAALGFCITANRALLHKQDIKAFSEFSIGEASKYIENDDVPEYKRKTSKIAGVIVFAIERRTKEGERFASYKIEDETGAIELAIFSKQYAALQRKFMQGDAVWVECKLKKGIENNSVRANCVAIGLLSEKREKHVKEIILATDENFFTKAANSTELKKIIAANSGEIPVKLEVIIPNENKCMHLNLGKVLPSDALLDALENAWPGELFVCRNYYQNIAAH